MQRSADMVRETGTALAVLALFILTLLLPMHQVAGLQRDLAQLGYEPAVTWSVCGEIHSDGTPDKSPTAVKCPATGIGKYEFAGIMPDGAGIGVVRQVTAVRYDGTAVVGFDSPRPHIGQPRAPPVTV